MPNKSDDPALFRLFNEIGIISQLATTMFERVMPHDLTLAQFSVLNHLSKRDDQQAPAKMANAFQVSKGTMTSTLGKLEAKGFVVITPNPKDGRGKFVGITATGLAARSEAVAALGPDLAWLSDKTVSHDVSGLTQQLATIRELLDARRDG
ncbi:MAG: MarR family transcriptional regulator [Pseudomonadota bacterium]